MNTCLPDRRQGAELTRERARFPDLQARVTEFEQALQEADQLRRLGARVFGAVLNEVVVSNAADDDFMQYFYHDQPHQEAPESRLRSRLAKANFWRFGAVDRSRPVRRHAPDQAKEAGSPCPDSPLFFLPVFHPSPSPRPA